MRPDATAYSFTPRQLKAIQDYLNQMHNLFLDAIIHGVGTLKVKYEMNHKVDLLLSVASYIAHTHESPTLADLLAWSHYQISKDSDLLLSLQIQSLRPIELWGKGYIAIQTIQPGSDPISVVRIGCRLRRPGAFHHHEEKH